MARSIPRDHGHSIILTIPLPAFQFSAAVPAFLLEGRRRDHGKEPDWGLTAGLLLIIGFTGVCSVEAQPSTENKPALTIGVRNYAGLKPDALAKAEEIAGRICGVIGVEIHWVGTVLKKQPSLSNSIVGTPFTEADLQLNIVPREMTARYGLPQSVLGLAPGTGPNRDTILIFDNRVDDLYLDLIKAYRLGDISVHLSEGQILG